MTLEVKIIAGLVALIALLGLTYLGYRTVYASGVVSGKAQVQAAWDIDKAAIAKLADDAKERAIAQEAAAQKRNQETLDDYQTRLAAAHASAGILASQLRDARARLTAGGSKMPAPPDQPGTPAGAAAPGVGQADVLLGDALAECAATRAGYSALIAQLTPQL